MKGHADHANKEIREAIQYAEQRGWRFEMAGPRAHIYGTLYCPETSRDGCRRTVLSTPRNPQNHARRIRREVDRCPHRADDTENGIHHETS
jgi:hypothetical protein